MRRPLRIADRVDRPLAGLTTGQAETDALSPPAQLRTPAVGRRRRRAIKVGHSRIPKRVADLRPGEGNGLTERCPWCASPISRPTFLAIERRIRFEEQQKAAALTERLHEKFRKEVAAAAQAAAKEARAATAKQLAMVVAEKDAAVKRASALETEEAQRRQQVLEDAERRQLAELANQRQMLERDHQRAILKLRADFTRATEATKKKISDLERKVQNRTAHELGEGAEIDLFTGLRDTFPGDHITRVRKGEAGADIHHAVYHNGQACGLIVIDSKNRRAWQNTFVTKLRRDQLDAEADHAILATTVFPAGEKELCLRDGVILVRPERTAFVLQLLRGSMVRMHLQGLSMTERNAKMGRLYTYITSEPCARRFQEAARLTDDLMALDAQETKDHQHVWARRGRMTLRLKSVLHDVDAAIATIVEGTDVGLAPAEPRRSPVRRSRPD